MKNLFSHLSYISLHLAENTCDAYGINKNYLNFLFTRKYIEQHTLFPTSLTYHTDKWRGMPALFVVHESFSVNHFPKPTTLDL